MNIVMLGHSGVGKTTYMASMYGTMRRGIDGFGLSTPDSRVDRDLAAACRRIEEGDYPAATDQRTEYDLMLTYDEEPCFPFTWLDFRGGALTERRDNSEGRVLHEDVTAADGLLLFCDASALSDRGTRRQIGRMVQLVSGAVRDIEHPYPLGIVLTKMDQVDEPDDNELKHIFGGLVASVSASETVVGSLLPIACGQQSRNVELPVLFVLHFGILCQVLRLRHRIEQREQARRRYASRRGLFDEIWSAIVSEPSYGDLANAAAREVQAQYETLQPLLEPAQALERHLDELQTF